MELKVAILRKLVTTRNEQYRHSPVIADPAAAAAAAAHLVVGSVVDAAAQVLGVREARQSEKASVPCRQVLEQPRLNGTWW